MFFRSDSCKENVSSIHKNKRCWLEFWRGDWYFLKIEKLLVVWNDVLWSYRKNSFIFWQSSLFIWKWLIFKIDWVFNLLGKWSSWRKSALWHSHNLIWIKNHNEIFSGNSLKSFSSCNVFYKGWKKVRLRNHFWWFPFSIVHWSFPAIYPENQLEGIFLELSLLLIKVNNLHSLMSNSNFWISNKTHDDRVFIKDQMNRMFKYNSSFKEMMNYSSWVTFNDVDNKLIYLTRFRFNSSFSCNCEQGGIKILVKNITI